MRSKVSEMVKRGHDQAAELKSSCGAVDVRDVAKLISDLATQLDVQLARSNAMAAENAGLKNALEWLYETVSSESVSVPNEKYSSVTNAAQVLSETPATDACQAEVRAQGVDMFALMFAEEAIKSNNITTGWRAKSSRAASEYAEALREDAAQLRKGAAL
ncbi:hypothetical protein G6546_07935 [Citrobacter portucalensis]|uniref:hypothetical protein n=1 Tax=Citrobacter portucalensis TaxID=1639133 RepID=UPI00140F8D34|nr:hypothetical protein [Citrobacter portucalensis]NHR80765.1 hypothetical protein [Citrobacter portucalensis]